MKTGKKKIMLIVPMLHQGGFERVCVATARLLEPYYDVCIVLFDSKDIAYDIRGLQVVDLHMGVRESLLGKALNIGKRSLAVRKLKRKMGIDIAYSFGPSANMVNVFSGRSAQVWVGIRSYMDMENARKIRLFSKRADLVVCCSKRIEEEVRERYRCGKAVTLYNPLDAAELRKQAAGTGPELPWEDREGIIVSMGREDDVKGFWHLLKAFGEMCKTVPRAKLMIVGEGDFGEYRTLAQELGVAKQVYFTGMKRNPFPYLGAAALYVLTSYHEGFPNALIEAMALGIPVISTDCLTGPREILQSGERLYGVLIPNMSPEKDMDASHISEEERRLAGEMARMFTDREYRERQAAASLERAGDFGSGRYVEQIRRLVDGADRKEVAGKGNGRKGIGD